MALGSETQRERRTKINKNKPERTRSTYCIQPTKRGGTSPLYACGRRLPVKSTWLKAIKNGNFDSWPGLTYNNAAKYFPHSVETLKGHMVKSSQGVRSTKKNKYQKHNNQKKPSQGKIHKQSDTADIPSQQKTK